jgi:riboflavin biosynthesis pyrimidine reductase
MSTKNILIATNSVSTPHSLNKKLRDSGYQVIEAQNADLVSINMANLGAQQINLIICDTGINFIENLLTGQLDTALMLRSELALN